MLQAVDERLSIWGWETGTGTRFAVVVDAWGKAGNKGLRGIADGDLRGVSLLISFLCLGGEWDGNGMGWNGQCGVQKMLMAGVC